MSSNSFLREESRLDSSNWATWKVLVNFKTWEGLVGIMLIGIRSANWVGIHRQKDASTNMPAAGEDQ